jgi:hypothetical protein
MANPVYFETGYIVIGAKQFRVQEITVNATRDLNPYYVSDSKEPLSIRAGRKKIEFTCKRAFSDAILAKMYEYDCEFTMILFNADPDTDQKLMTLNKCRLSQDNIGPINGQDVVMEDIQGQAGSRSLDFDEINAAVAAACNLSSNS